MLMCWSQSVHSIFVDGYPLVAFTNPPLFSVSSITAKFFAWMSFTLLLSSNFDSSTRLIWPTAFHNFMFATSSFIFRVSLPASFLHAASAADTDRHCWVTACPHSLRYPPLKARMCSQWLLLTPAPWLWLHAGFPTFRQFSSFLFWDSATLPQYLDCWNNATEMQQPFTIENRQQAFRLLRTAPKILLRDIAGGRWSPTASGAATLRVACRSAWPHWDATPAAAFFCLQGAVTLLLHRLKADPPLQAMQHVWHCNRVALHVTGTCHSLQGQQLLQNATVHDHPTQLTWTNELPLFRPIF